MSYANTRLITVAAAAFLFTSVGATAQAAVQSAGQGQAASERKICVKIDVTYSRLPQKVCRTEAEWIRTEGGVPTPS